MSYWLVGILILALAVNDYFIFDVQNQRWGWLKEYSKPVRITIISSVMVMTLIRYAALSFKCVE
ncbi:hypothetical protein [Priestia megaterium]|jgi:hypothetical protein|uniref:hypothetical protein n=1 Tax=Priestia megaterium TaxID=1404 RepID=UPI0028557D01|nr:hypothetical protein [Priestia megaterium]MDR7242497.1 hypothetical protein [Priestia megaterium]